MRTRRSFLRALGLSPLAVPAASLGVPEAVLKEEVDAIPESKPVYLSDSSTIETDFGVSLGKQGPLIFHKGFSRRVYGMRDLHVWLNGRCMSDPDFWLEPTPMHQWTWKVRPDGRAQMAYELGDGWGISALALDHLVGVMCYRVDDEARYVIFDGTPKPHVYPHGIFPWA